MMRQDWLISIYRQDRRYRAGERLFIKYQLTGMDRSAVDREIRELRVPMYPESGWRFEVEPATRTVRNLMTGQNIEIAADTPLCCDPSSERFWSM
jgi:hypothetical protein